MHVTREEACYKCHSKMNPLGLPFETYDHYGRFRFDELDKPVDATSKIVNSGVPGVDGEVNGPFELIERLAQLEPGIGSVQNDLTVSAAPQEPAATPMPELVPPNDSE